VVLEWVSDDRGKGGQPPSRPGDYATSGPVDLWSGRLVNGEPWTVNRGPWTGETG
jgi:hypothetical protein